MHPMDIRLEEAGLHIVFRVLEDGDVVLLHASSLPFRETAILPHTLRQYRLCQIQAAGWDQSDHHGQKHTGCQPGLSLRYAGHEIRRDDKETCVSITLENGIIRAVSIWRIYSGCQTVRAHTEITCLDAQGVDLTYVSAFALTGICGRAPQIEKHGWVSYVLNSWCCELQWRRQSLAALGLAPVSAADALHDPDQYQNFSLQLFSPCGRGTWSTSEYLPMGAFENDLTGQAMAWQIEAAGPWQWEISTIGGVYYLLCAGPDDERHHWARRLAQGESYRTPWTAISFVQGSREDALASLNDYRRRIRPDCDDTRYLPVIFNDYMALLGDPTEDKLLPLIDQAAALGGKYFCVDSGWYAEGNWWDTVGEWQFAPSRFPHGLQYILNAIRRRGMIPGLWIEIEVMGVGCPLAAQCPDEWFFMRHGRRVIDHGRYQLDFSNPQVRAYADQVADRLIREYGVGYLKIDYNINGGYGTETRGRNPGAALEEHQAAYRAWLQGLLERYPGLVIENCASGGMRMDYGLLSLLSIQSLSDQDDVIRLAPIACAAASAVTPEQAACWSLPKPEMDEEETAFCMVNAMTGRIHQSGALDQLPAATLDLMQEAFSCYQSYCRRIPSARPIWPLGLPEGGDTLLSMGLEWPEETLLFIWAIDCPVEEVTIQLERAYDRVDVFYPARLLAQCAVSADGRSLRMKLPRATCSRILRLAAVQEQ